MINETGQIIFLNIIIISAIYLLLTAIKLLRSRHLYKSPIKHEILKGIRNGEFYVHYQPLFETHSGSCCGAEALIRWRRVDGKSVPPSIFIPEAEKEGIIIQLTQHLFSLIADDLKEWEISAPFHLGVNISSAHLIDEKFTTDIISFFETLDDSFKLVLEITEHSAVQKTELVYQRLNALRHKGCYVAIDDFGTGYSSLGLLQTLPIDYLKIDKMFTDCVRLENMDTDILECIISLCKKLGIDAIAEGVTDDYQVDWLKSQQVNFTQGFYYSRPKNALDFIEWYYDFNKNINFRSVMQSK
ncbi:EAL domain-containing protein [Enterobacter quasiroggenkampii]|uniref:EAL domain-containing protein n=1 Tax=Enterobacter quasiroggenkampii TaxID=2497436 RepID=UPI0021CEA60B|nr:EAL domain-containing protein [Enterobacter quasiroggenkampii]MCU6278585.1 EAL domain-containing protein [Enterobacter quasiroggenkampii]MCU6346170.1 EAL domain-containing protein [Enterobacter quasiroggenkampii]MCU6383990.1 EAL domain-containing protein [Enterobacter quasiroggenkampii]MCU6393173.1 EAL domain-containing protein [Enterobacter quasiroggenkampii]MCU6401814.1 EAL domain-containing protein [Enterobacter quasiroggenkampii]